MRRVGQSVAMVTQVYLCTMVTRIQRTNKLYVQERVSAVRLVCVAANLQLQVH